MTRAIWRSLRIFNSHILVKRYAQQRAQWQSRFVMNEHFEWVEED